MPTITTVRTGLLRAIREKILPWAQLSGDKSALLLQPSELARQGAKVTRRTASPLPQTQRGYSRVSIAHWPQEGLNAFNVPYIGFVLEGEADLEIGITRSAWKQLKEPPAYDSRCIVTLPRNTFFLIPPGVAHPDGRQPHWLRAHPEQAHSHIFWLHILQSGALCHTCTSQHGYHTSTRNLFIKDPYLTTLTDMCLEELRGYPSAVSPVLQSILCTLFLRVERKLARQDPFYTDHGVQTSLLGPPEDKMSTPADMTLDRACNYIRAHLDEPLTLSLIASHAYISVSQMKRIFQTELKMTVMQYVTHCRVETAKSLLDGTELSIREISSLAGYKHPEQFSRLFLKHSGLSPRAYRQKYK